MRIPLPAEVLIGMQIRCIRAVPVRIGACGCRGRVVGGLGRAERGWGGGCGSVAVRVSGGAHTAADCGSDAVPVRIGERATLADVPRSRSGFAVPARIPVEVGGGGAGTADSPCGSCGFNGARKRRRSASSRAGSWRRCHQVASTAAAASSSSSASQSEADPRIRGSGDVKRIRPDRFRRSRSSR